MSKRKSHCCENVLRQERWCVLDWLIITTREGVVKSRTSSLMLLNNARESEQLHTGVFSESQQLSSATSVSLLLEADTFHLDFSVTHYIICICIY